MTNTNNSFKAISKFRPGSTTYKCGICGKMTRDTGMGEASVDLCVRCYDGAGLENEHSDYGHGDLMRGCPRCYPLEYPEFS